MNEHDELIILNTDEMELSKFARGMWENRLAAYHMYDAPGVPKCSIAVLAYNRLNKTKYCVECVLKYTQDVDFELILVDNGSDDGTLDFFQDVTYEKKQIVRITKNMGINYAIAAVKDVFKGKYLVFVSNDIYVTQNWLSNLLKCYESDPSMGLIEPVSSNVSNLQEVNISYSSMDDMQIKAAAYNKSDPAKWEERMRLISIIYMFSRHVIDTVGTSDTAFVHDFSEDDLAARLRRSGYKLMLCRDTWVCHDHDFRNMEDKDPTAFQESLLSGRDIYREKYHGIDPWDDINNFEFSLLTPIDTLALNAGELTALTVDVRCGTPVLEIRNRLKRRGRTDVRSCAFTTQAKYYVDLQTVADDVVCDRIDYIQSAYADGMFDIVALGEPINTYPSPVTLMQRLYNLIKPGGVLLFKLRNTDDFNAFLRSAGLSRQYDPDLPAGIPPDEVAECLKLFGGRDITVSAEHENLADNDKSALLKLLKAVKPKANNEDLARLTTKHFVFKVIRRVSR